MSSREDKSSADPLVPVLRDIEAELKKRLQEACETEASGIANESAAEIRRLEDSLLAAAVAAEQTIALRRHIEQRKEDTVDSPTSPQSKPRSSAEPNEGSESVIKLREFRDSSGQLWRAWPVTPGQARPGRTAERYLGEFHKGWICFEALEGNARRRLPRQPEHWNDLQEPELVQLLEQAVSAPERKRQLGSGGPEPIALQ